MTLWANPPSDVHGFGTFFVFSTGLVAADWVILLVSVLTLFVILKRIGNEERLVLEHFGDKYRDYMKRTKRLLPRLRCS